MEEHQLVNLVHACEVQVKKPDEVIISEDDPENQDFFVVWQVCSIIIYVCVSVYQPQQILPSFCSCT